MAKLYGFEGELVRFLKTFTEISLYGDPPNFDAMIEFDVDTNPSVVEGIDTDWNGHTLIGTTLRRDGQIVTINDPGDDYLARKQADSAEELIRYYMAGLARLDIVDFGYAYVGRLIAKADGADDPTIFAIIDRDSATAYITGMSQWAALPASVRQWLIVDLESRAYDAMFTRMVVEKLRS
jgi:hypothetical protein